MAAVFSHSSRLPSLLLSLALFLSLSLANLRTCSRAIHISGMLFSGLLHQIHPYLPSSLSVVTHCCWLASPRHRPWDKDSGVYSFPTFARTNYHKLEVLKPQKFSFSQFWMLKVQNQGFSRVGSFLGAQRRICSLSLSWFLMVAGNLSYPLAFRSTFPISASVVT